MSKLRFELIADPTNYQPRLPLWPICERWFQTIMSCDKLSAKAEAQAGCPDGPL